MLREMRALLDGANETVRAALERTSDLETRARAIVDAATAVYASVDERELLEHVAKKLPSEDPAAALDAVDGADLWLALASARGDAAALAEVEVRLRREVPAALSRIRATKDEIDEIGQIVREKLFVGSAPKILDYAGRGALAAWMRAVIVRTAISARRDGSDALERDTDGDADLAARAAGNDVELDAMKARYAADYAEILREALGTLSQRDRTVLKMFFVDDLNIDAIGEAYGVHRATAARWIARCREHLADETRRRLAERLRVPAGELHTLERLCMSQIDFSLRSALI
jgi:RNA polymerase sigma-70 factor (ECF subfamily)